MINNTIRAPCCSKCNRKFTTFYGLDRHIQKKIPCDRVLNCKKCKRVFKQKNDLKRHTNRKTSCDPIHGNMLVSIKDNRCQFCGKEFKSKYSLKNHYVTCKIKNGGMESLFNTLLRQQAEIDNLKKQLDKPTNINTIINNNIKNHFNTNINIPLVCFGGGYEREKMLQIVRDNLDILYRPVAADISHQEQIADRVGEFVQAVYRNPNHKELQNIYTKHNFQDSDRDNAFIYKEDVHGLPQWHIGDWSNVSIDILNKIYAALSQTPIKKKEDVLRVMDTVMKMGRCGSPTGLKISDNNLQELYCEIGRRMGFTTLSLE